MNPLVNIAKITPPTLPKILPRPRLQNLLEKHKDKKLILILGQAAQGKTTLVASYVKMSKILSAWITLEKEDSHPFSLFYSIVKSLQQVLKEIDFSHLLSLPLSPMERSAEIPLFREWTCSLFALISSPLRIILDGLDWLSPDARAFNFLQILVEDAPPNIHWVLLSREIPPPSLEFQHPKMKQEAFLLTNEEFAFTPEEIGEFFRKIRGISFDADQLRKIYLATEGWVGGLILLGESLDGFPEPCRGKFISEELPPRFQREVFRYFAKEIFSSQPEPVQKFLIKSSMIDLIEPDFMRDFTGTEDAEEILQGLVRRNLFVHSIYTEEKWLFRYHQLFRDFLKVRFKSAIKEEERQSLFLKAGQLYEKRGEIENALKYFLEAKAYPQAGSVIGQSGMNLLQSGRKEDLSQWILAFPEEFIQENPWLLFYRTMTRRYLGGREDVVALQKAYSLFKQKGDRRGILASLAHLIEASIYTGIHLIPLERLIKEGEAILQSSEMNEYPREKAMLWYFLGLGHILGDGDIRRGILACQNAYLISKQIKDLTLQGYALTFSALGWGLVGEFSLANETCKKLEKIVPKIVLPELRASNFMVTCILACYQGDFARAQGLLERLQGEIEKYGFISISPWVYEISGYLSFARGEIPKAEEIGKQYLSLTTTMGNDFFKALALRLLGMVYLHQGDFQKAREITEQSIKVLTQKAASKYELQKVKVLLGLIGYHLKDYRYAERKLEEALEYFKEISSHNSAAEAHFVFALLKWDQGKNNEEAASHLQTGFKIAEEMKYDYFFFLGLKYLTQVCLLALELKVARAMDYAAHLLSTRLSSVAEEALKKIMKHPDSKFREKAWEIRKTIHRAKVPILRIETLGGFQVFRGDSPMAEKEWDRNQPKKLLKAIVSHDSKRTPTELLIEDLWPEEKPHVAEENLKITLCRLRKSLGPVVHREFGFSYVHLHDHFVFLDPELCKVDGDRFLSLLQKGEEKEDQGDRKEALSDYAQAMELYKGDFLPEEVYAPWADLKREKLREKYIEFLNRMAALYEKQGASTKAIACCKKAVQADPLLEEGYRSLMTLYSGKGMLNEALRTYEACKKAIAEGLNTEPDPLTNSLYQKIVEKLKPGWA